MAWCLREARSEPAARAHGRCIWTTHTPGRPAASTAAAARRRKRRGMTTRTEARCGRKRGEIPRRCGKSPQLCRDDNENRGDAGRKSQREPERDAGGSDNENRGEDETLY